jgi:hypothetical protein
VPPLERDTAAYSKHVSEDEVRAEQELENAIAGAPVRGLTEMWTPKYRPSAGQKLLNLRAQASKPLISQSHEYAPPAQPAQRSASAAYSMPAGSSPKRLPPPPAQSFAPPDFSWKIAAHIRTIHGKDLSLKIGTGGYDFRPYSIDHFPQIPTCLPRLPQLLHRNPSPV